MGTHVYFPKDIDKDPTKFATRKGTELQHGTLVTHDVYSVLDADVVRVPEGYRLARSGGGTTPLHDALAGEVSYYTVLESLSLEPKRETGVYRSAGGVEATLERNGSCYFFFSKHESIDGINVLLRQIRAGQIRPVESWEKPQVPMSPAAKDETEKKLDDLRRAHASLQAEHADLERRFDAHLDKTLRQKLRELGNDLVDEARRLAQSHATDGSLIGELAWRLVRSIP